MASLADSIVTSHKEAAKRATEYLQGARNLKLKPPEALELVARVLGVANWQTLLGMAKAGTAPRVACHEDAPAAEPASLRNAIVSLEIPYRDANDVVRLAHYFSPAAGRSGEHPRLTREIWGNGAPVRPYWEWVYYEIIGNSGLLPWDADAMESFQIARAAGVTVEYTENGRWIARAPAGLYIEVYYAEDEIRAWGHACEAVEAEGNKRTGGRWPRLALVEKMQVLERQFWPRNECGIPVFQPGNRISDEIDSENRAVCRAASFVLEEHGTKRGLKYRTEDGKDFELSDEVSAYAHQAALIGKYVGTALNWSAPDAWAWQPEAWKVSMAGKLGYSGRALYAQSHPELAKSGVVDVCWLSNTELPK